MDRQSRFDAVIFLLEQAREKRSSAEQARRLALGIATDRMAAEINRYAAELEQTACEIEERACAVAETAEKSEDMAADLAASLQEARRRIAETYPKRASR